MSDTVLFTLQRYFFIGDKSFLYINCHFVNAKKANIRPSLIYKIVQVSKIKEFKGGLSSSSLDVNLIC